MHAMKQILAVILTLALPAIAFGQSDDPELAAILQRVRERVNRHYLDLQTVAWTDTAKQELLDEKQAPREIARELVYDTIVRLQEPSPEDHGVPFYIREVGELQSVDGKPARKNEQPKTTDPRTANMGSLLFLLVTDERARNYAFSYGGFADLNGRRVLRIDVASRQQTPPRVTWEDSFVFFGVRYHFQVSGVKFNKGSLWVDPETYDALQLDWRSDPFEFHRNKGDREIRYEIGMTVRFHSMPFESPQQTIVAPVSLEFATTITKTKDDVNLYRTTHTFTNYKRFTGDARVIAAEGTAK
jgi:hypothetical protein